MELPGIQQALSAAPMLRNLRGAEEMPRRKQEAEVAALAIVNLQALRKRGRQRGAEQRLQRFDVRRGCGRA